MSNLFDDNYDNAFDRMNDLNSLNDVPTDGAIPIEVLTNELKKSWSGKGSENLRKSMRDRGLESLGDNDDNSYPVFPSLQSGQFGGLQDSISYKPPNSLELTNFDEQISGSDLKNSFYLDNSLTKRQNDDPFPKLHIKEFDMRGSTRDYSFHPQFPDQPSITNPPDLQASIALPITSDPVELSFNMNMIPDSAPLTTDPGFFSPPSFSQFDLPPPAPIHYENLNLGSPNSTTVEASVIEPISSYQSRQYVPNQSPHQPVYQSPNQYVPNQSPHQPVYQSPNQHIPYQSPNQHIPYQSPNQPVYQSPNQHIPYQSPHQLVYQSPHYSSLVTLGSPYGSPASNLSSPYSAPGSPFGSPRYPAVEGKKRKPLIAHTETGDYCSEVIDMKPPKEKRRWTEEEDRLLIAAVKKYGEGKWKEIASEVPGRNNTQVNQRYTKVLKQGIKKGPWSKEEDNLLLEGVKLYADNWKKIAEMIPGRSAGKCRERYNGYLTPFRKVGNWTPEEDNLILQLQKEWGNNWSGIAQQLPGRSSNDVRTHYLTLVRHKSQ